MTDEPTSATPASLPSSDDVQKMSAAQASAKLDELGAQEEFRNKLTGGDGKTVRLFQDLARQRSQTDQADAIVTVAADLSQPLPRDGGANRNGMSHRDEVAAAQWQLEAGASPEEVGEFEIGAAMVGPEGFFALERDVRARCLNNPEFVKAYLAGDPQARLTMDRWHRIAVTSRPLPPVPTTGIPR